MARRMLGGLLLAAAMLTPVTGGKAQPPAVASHNATYDFYLGGIWAGEMTVEADFGSNFDGAGIYRAEITARTAGIVGFFFKAGVEAETVGRIGAAGLSPVRFTADAYERRRRRLVEISYDDGSPASVVAEPAYRLRPWSISARGQPGIADPLSAAFEALAPAGPDAICNQTADIFDGERRWAIEIGSPHHEGGQEGERIRCDTVYVRIAGFEPALMGKWANAKSDHHMTREGRKPNCATLCLKGGQPAALFDTESETIKAVFACNPRATLADYAAKEVEVQGFWSAGQEDGLNTFVPEKIRTAGSTPWVDVDCATMHD